jgi:hypothetical protein
MRRRLISTAIVLGALVAPAAAAADGWLIPPDGAARVASSWPSATSFEMLEFTLYLDDDEGVPEPFQIDVATSPAIDAADVVATYTATPRADDPKILSARTSTGDRWLGTPGVYYWRARSTEDGAALPVRTLRITPALAADPIATPAPAPAVAPAPIAQVLVQPRLAASTARIAVRRAIALATQRSPRGLRYRCVTAPGAASCRPAWRDTRYAYSGTLAVSAALDGLTAAFSGVRAERSCIARQRSFGAGLRRCGRAIAWSKRL